MPKFRSVDQIKADYPELLEMVRETRKVFGDYTRIEIIDNGECVFKWGKDPIPGYLNPEFKSGLDPKRKPHLWTDGARNEADRKV